MQENERKDKRKAEGEKIQGQTEGKEKGQGERIDCTGFGDIEIIQKEDQFCYGVDAVLLAHMASEMNRTAKNGDCICDLGTGNGIVPLVLSHKLPQSRILGIEVQQSVYELALRNVKHNGLEERIHIMNCNVKEIDELREADLFGKFGIVTSNPPYTADSCGIQGGNEAIRIARHEIEGTLDDFVRCASQLLCYRGDFFMVHRPDRLVDIFTTCRKYRLEPKDLIMVTPKPAGKPNIVLVHCIKDSRAQLKVHPELAVRDDSGNYTEKVLRAYEKL